MLYLTSFTLGCLFESHCLLILNNSHGPLFVYIVKVVPQPRLPLLFLLTREILGEMEADSMRRTDMQNHAKWNSVWDYYLNSCTETATQNQLDLRAFCDITVK